MISIAKNGTGETVTIPQMRAYINMQYDKYDVGAALDEQVARLAANKKVIMSGNVKTRESQLQAWNLAKDNLLDAELADGLHVSSILTEEVGGYNVVTDATKVGENDVSFLSSLGCQSPIVSGWRASSPCCYPLIICRLSPPLPSGWPPG